MFQAVPEKIAAVKEERKMNQEIEQKKQNGFRLGCYIRESIIEFKSYLI